jgi:hypothetical protein
MIRHPESVSTKLLTLFNELSSFSILEDFILGDGTSLALKYGHRTSLDMDFFTLLPFDSLMYTDIFVNRYPETEVVNRTEGSLSLMIDGIKTDLLHHPYPLITDPVSLDSAKAMSLSDMAAMKVNAVTNRGSKKDFSDLLLLHTLGIGPAQAVDFFCSKYGEAGRFLAIRSLNWFEDADSEPDPIYLNGWTWPEVRARMSELTRGLIL